MIDFGSQCGLSTYFYDEKLILPNFSRLRRVATSVSYPEVRIRKETEIGLVQTWSTGFGQDFKTEIWPMLWGWYLRFVILWKYNWEQRGKVIPRTWFHSFFSRKKSEIQIAFTFFEKWKVKNDIPSLFFEKCKWNWNGSKSRTKSENEKNFLRILGRRESRWSLTLRRYKSLRSFLYHST